jgi:hypothetical protein
MDMTVRRKDAKDAKIFFLLNDDVTRSRMGRSEIRETATSRIPVLRICIQATTCRHAAGFVVG